MKYSQEQLNNAYRCLCRYEYNEPCPYCFKVKIIKRKQLTYEEEAQKLIDTVKAGKLSF